MRTAFIEFDVDFWCLRCWFSAKFVSANNNIEKYLKRCIIFCLFFVPRKLCHVDLQWYKHASSGHYNVVCQSYYYILISEINLVISLNHTLLLLDNTYNEYLSIITGNFSHTTNQTVDSDKEKRLWGTWRHLAIQLTGVKLYSLD